MTKSGQEHISKSIPYAVCGLAGAGAVALLVGLVTFAAPRPAVALPAYAQQTHLACGRCHVSPAGGGQRTAFGNAFLANGHKLSSSAGSKKASGQGAASSPAAVAPPSPTVDLDYAQAQAWSLDRPYYSHFLFGPAR
jgi:hypothetical protein